MRTISPNWRDPRIYAQFSHRVALPDPDRASYAAIVGWLSHRGIRGYMFEDANVSQFYVIRDGVFCFGCPNIVLEFKMQWG